MNVCVSQIGVRVCQLTCEQKRVRRNGEELRMLALVATLSLGQQMWSFVVALTWGGVLKWWHL